MKKDYSLYLQHIIESIGNIENYISKLSKLDFLKNREKQDAVIRKIEVIGEAVKNIPLSFRGKYPEIPWSKATAARDKMIHAYFDVNLDIVWDIVKKDLPKLKEQIKEILKQGQ